MGEARRRGTKEERQAKGAANEEKRKIECELQQEKHAKEFWDSMTREQRINYVAGIGMMYALKEGEDGE